MSTRASFLTWTLGFQTQVPYVCKVVILPTDLSLHCSFYYKGHITYLKGKYLVVLSSDNCTTFRLRLHNNQIYMQNYFILNVKEMTFVM